MPELPRHRLAVCAWTFGPGPLHETLDTIARLGFGGVELVGDLDRLASADLPRQLAELDLTPTSITPADVDIAHPDAAVRSEAVAYYERLVHAAASIGCGIVGCHGVVSRVRPIGSMEEERRALRDAVGAITDHAATAGVTVAYEALNRYESCHVRTAEEALALIADVGRNNLGVLLDAYHMNIEEADLPAAIRAAGGRLALLHLADSNREGLGRGHLDLAALWAAVEDVGYTGPVVLECTAPGPDPFTPDKGPGFRSVLEDHLEASLDALRRVG